MTLGRPAGQGVLSPLHALLQSQKKPAGHGQQYDVPQELL